jgi:N,N'-diacetyllegionaminate synthase
MSKVFVIAEAGVNHNGSIDMAKQLIDVAAQAGADAVKFQTFRADLLVTKTAVKASYQKKFQPSTDTQYLMLKKLEIDATAHDALIEHCKTRSIQFLSTPFDSVSIDLLSSKKIDTFKIPSGEITNLPYLRHIARVAKKVILSTGMSNLGEIELAIEVLIAGGVKKENIVALHATTEYPCPLEEVNLLAMQTIQRAFQIEVGYSDHTEGIEISLAAVALGARVIEKHFTLDRTLEGPDHRASIEPQQLSDLVRAIRNIERALGDGIKKPTQSELSNMKVARKSIVAATKIYKGETLTSENIVVKRPAEGISPIRWDEVLGSIAQQDYLPDDFIKFSSKI